MKSLLLKIVLEIAVLCLIFAIIYYFLRKRIINKTIAQIDELLSLIINETKSKNLKKKLTFYKSDISLHYVEMKNYISERQNQLLEEHPDIMEKLLTVLEI